MMKIYLWFAQDNLNDENVYLWLTQDNLTGKNFYLCFMGAEREREDAHVVGKLSNVTMYYKFIA